MPPALEPFTLAGRHVRLEPLDPRHVDDLAAAAALDRSTYEFTVVPDGIGGTRRYVDDLIGARERGLVIPFAQVDAASERAVGCTRFMEFRWWRDREAPDEVEVGGTWLGAAAQRTPLNTEAKLLLLGHAFETWGVWRVAICTDARNERSRRAIERLGAPFEGVLRSHRPAHGDAATEPAPRDSALYGITAADWPAIADRLRARLDR